MPDTKIRVDAVMNEIEHDVRTRLRRHLIKRGGAAEYHDEEFFEAVRAVLARAVEERNLDATLLPELLDTDVEWRLQTPPVAVEPSPRGRALHPLLQAARAAADDAVAVRVPARTTSAGRITSTGCCSRASRSSRSRTPACAATSPRARPRAET